MGMPTLISLTDCPGLIDLMLTGDERGPSFTIRCVQCAVGRVEGHATFEAVSPDFGLLVCYPGWYAGEHGAPAHVVIVGDTHTCLQWLPVEQADKLLIISRLRISVIDRMLCRVSV